MESDPFKRKLEADHVIDAPAPGTESPEVIRARHDKSLALGRQLDTQRTENGQKLEKQRKKIDPNLGPEL